MKEVKNLTLQKPFNPLKRDALNKAFGERDFYEHLIFLLLRVICKATVSYLLKMSPPPPPRRSVSLSSLVDCLGQAEQLMPPSLNFDTYEGPPSYRCLSGTAKVVFSHYLVGPHMLYFTCKE